MNKLLFDVLHGQFAGFVKVGVGYTECEHYICVTVDKAQDFALRILRETNWTPEETRWGTR